jgi:histidinol-phosphatase
MNADWRTRYEVAVEAAERAARWALAHFPQADSGDFAGKVEWKDNLSPVSFADRGAEAILRDTILGRFPDDGLLGEELGESQGSTGYRWIVDPIDGTRSYVRGIPLWGTLVAVQYKGEVIAGAAVLPVLGHTYRALRGDGAYRGDRPLQVSRVDRLADALTFCASLTSFVKAGRQEVLVELARRTQRERAFGNFYGLALVAEGAGELMVDCGVYPWDIAALQPIVEEAGGRFGDWDGGTGIDRPDVIASNGRVHEEALRILQGT